MFKRLAISSNAQSVSIDLRLWEELRAGKAEALNELYDRYVLLLFNYGSKITTDQGLIEDCIQELFVELWEKREKISSTTSVKFYLLKSISFRKMRRLM
ncbi:MAG: sigma factor, partial [Bacteroidota bacterium]